MPIEPALSLSPIGDPGPPGFGDLETIKSDITAAIGRVDEALTPNEELFRVAIADALAAYLNGEGVKESEDNPLQAMITQAISNMFLVGKGEEEDNPFQAMIAQTIANMLTVGGEDGESPLQPFFEALDAHVKGEGENAGKGGLFGELIAFVKGSGDEEGKGGLFAVLNQHVRGSEDKKGGLIAELTKVVHGENGLVAQMNKRGGEIMNEIQALWDRLFGGLSWRKPQQGDE